MLRFLIMGDVPENEAWDRKARAEQIRCKMCDQLISFDEREIYFERKLCDFCAHKLKKKD